LLIAAISLGAPASTIAQPRMIAMSSALCWVAKSPGSNYQNFGVNP
jgi:hypothetical protein